MDKQGATNHILTRLQAGSTRDEVVGDLSLILKAPPAVIERFVDQVISHNPGAATTPNTQMEMTESMESHPIQGGVTKPASSSSSLITDLPPGLQAIINESTARDTSPKESVTTQELLGSSQIALPQKATFEAPVEKTTKSGILDETSKANLELLSESVIQQLKKGRRHNDIVEAVCHQTGWHWNKSQRFVARVQTKNQDELQSGKNRVLIVMGLGIILVGLILAINGAIAISEYAILAATATTPNEALIAVSSQNVIFSFGAVITGIGMVIGGGFGIARALTDR